MRLCVSVRPCVSRSCGSEPSAVASVCGASTTLRPFQYEVADDARNQTTLAHPSEGVPTTSQADMTPRGGCESTIEAPARASLALCQALEREGLFMFSMSPNMLCIASFLGMVVEAVSRGSLPRGLTSGQLCAFFMLMGMSLPLVQANHDLAVELLD